MAVPKWNGGTKWNDPGSIWGPIIDTIGRYVRGIVRFTGRVRVAQPTERGKVT